MNQVHHNSMRPSSSPKPQNENIIEFDFANIVPSTESEVRDSGDYINEAYSWENFDFPHWRRWMSSNFHLSILCAITYLILIALGGRWMNSRKAYNLKGPLLLWNIVFAIFSSIAFLRTFPELWRILWSVGFYKSVCSSEGLTIQFAFWSWIGTLSKIVEFGDTAFVILRKKPLMFLHWFHHATTMLYTWFTFPGQEPCHRWLMTMNFFVHSLMYSYYALKAGGFVLPRLVAVFLTSLQIIQMVVGIYVNWYTWRELGSDRGCERYHFNLTVAAVMYTSYLVLFLNFFYNSYFKPSKRKLA